MNKKVFKYENKTHKNIRLKDLLMLFSVFALSIITVMVTSDVTPKNKNVSTDARVTDEYIQNTNTDTDKNDAPLKEASLSEYETEITSADEVAYEIIPVLNFEKPLDGAIIKPFSMDELIYSETMDDWRIHKGVDIACPVGSDVLSVERGCVKSVIYDINYGNTVIVESNDYVIKYSSLSSDVCVSEGDIVKKGDIIGKSSDTAMSEICDASHIHFEIMKNNEYINPLDVIEFN